MIFWFIFLKVQQANVSLPLSLAHLSPGNPTTPKRSARINFWISGIYFVYILFVYIFYICLHFILFTFSEVSPKLTVVVTKCDQFPRHNYVKLICNQPRLLLLARQGTIHTYIFIFLFAFINLCFCLHHCLFTIYTLGWDFAGLHNK